MRGDGAARFLAVGKVANPFVRGRHRRTPIIIAVVEQKSQAHAAGEQGGARIGVRELLFEGGDLSGVHGVALAANFFLAYQLDRLMPATTQGLAFVAVTGRSARAA